MPRAPDDSAPVAEALNIEDIIKGLAGDLQSLRDGKISVQDAMTRAVLAKQVFNGVRLYLNAQKLLGGSARDVTPLPAPDEPR